MFFFQALLFFRVPNVNQTDKDYVDSLLHSCPQQMWLATILKCCKKHILNVAFRLDLLVLHADTFYLQLIIHDSSNRSLSFFSQLFSPM